MDCEYASVSIVLFGVAPDVFHGQSLHLDDMLSSVMLVDLLNQAS